MPLALTRALRVLLCAALLPLATPVLASTDLHGDDSSFNLFNDTARALVSFTVSGPSGAYSANWLSEPMQPGNGLTLQFAWPTGGVCDLKTRFEYEDGSVQELLVTYCGTAAIFLENTGIRFD